MVYLFRAPKDLLSFAVNYRETVHLSSKFKILRLQFLLDSFSSTIQRRITSRFVKSINAVVSSEHLIHLRSVRSDSDK